MEEQIQKYNTPPPNYNWSQHATNGFSKRLSLSQVASYLIIIASICIYFSCVWSLLQNTALIVLLCLSGIIMVLSSAYCTLSDPTDRIIYYYKWSKFDKNIKFAPDYSQTIYCDLCDSFCQLKSKHCKECNRCVNMFDHHCMWFNNCVGNKTYVYFVISIFSAFSYSVILVIHTIIDSFIVNYSNGKQLTKIIVAWILSIALGIIAFLLFNLIMLHIYLKINRLTTYQFMQKNKKQEENQKKQVEKLKLQMEQIKQHQINMLKRQGQDKKIDACDISMSNIINLKQVYIGHSPNKQTRQINNETKEESNNNYIFSQQIQQQDHIQQSRKQEINQIKMGKSGKLPLIFRGNTSLKFILDKNLAESPTNRKIANDRL